MYWNRIEECLAADHPNYKSEECCIACKLPIQANEMVVFHAYKHNDDRPLEVGPIIRHSKCFPGYINA